MTSVSTDRRLGISAEAAVKVACKAASSANLTLSGEQTVGGVACVTDDRVLVKNQTDGTKNGIYIVDTGDWSRAPDFDGSLDVVRGTLVPVYSGSSTYAFYAVSNSSVTIDTTNITFVSVTVDVTAVTAFVQTLLDDTTATVFLATLGLTVSTFAKTVLDDASAAASLVTLGAPAALGAMGVPINFSLSTAVGSSALTISVKTAAGATPSATDPVYVPFRSGTTGAIVWRTISAALSLTVSSGSKLGHNSALKQYINGYFIDNAGTVELAVSSQYFGKQGTVSTTAEGGAGAADSGTVMYSTAARASVAFTCVALIESTQAAAGTWATLPSNVSLAPFDPPLISFAAHKNGSSQTIITATETLATFGTEVYDNGSLYDASASSWTPPPGTARIDGQIVWSTSTDQTNMVFRLRKNGVDFATVSFFASGTGSLTLNVNLSDECSGTDVYTLIARQDSGGNKDVSGGVDSSFFRGTWSPLRS